MRGEDIPQDFAISDQHGLSSTYVEMIVAHFHSHASLKIKLHIRGEYRRGLPASRLNKIKLHTRGGR